MRPIKRLRELLSSHASVYKDFAHHYDMVYFGRIFAGDDDQRIIQGVTVSAQHKDEHYCVGTIHGYDVVLVERTDTLRRPNSTKTEKYSWQIMQFDLKSNYDHPHVFIDGKHHDEVFYQTLFIKFARLTRVDNSLLGGRDSRFIKCFSAYTPPDAIDDLPLLLTSERAEMMAHHFSHLDFEWFQDRLIIYSVSGTPTMHLLDHMLRAGYWLASELDAATNTKNTPDSAGVDTEIN